MYVYTCMIPQAFDIVKAVSIPWQTACWMVCVLSWKDAGGSSGATRQKPKTTTTRLVVWMQYHTAGYYCRQITSTYGNTSRRRKCKEICTCMVCQILLRWTKSAMIAYLYIPGHTKHTLYMYTPHTHTAPIPAESYSSELTNSTSSGDLSHYEVRHDFN